ncbi:MAG: MATE family efflux transporter, partial [Clostridia bacterium]|nr:MATE family efflux transporter [Clostridia bacterium]
MEQTKRKELFNGSLTKNILLFALPVMATGMLQMLFNTADLAVVGRFDGNDALAAVGSTTAMIHLIVNLLMGLSVGASVVVAQAYGAKDDNVLSKSVHTALAVSVVAGLLVSVVGFFFGGKILTLMGTAPEVLDDATLYVKIYFLGAPVSMIYNFGAAILRAVGNTKTPLIFLSAAGVINVLLNLFLVIVFDLGVAGVAIATITSQAVSSSLVLIYLARRSDACRFYLKKLAFHQKELVRMIAIGLPAGLQSSLFAISNVMIQSSVNSFGSVEIIAGNTAAMSIEGFVYILMNSFSNAGMTFIGQTIGAERYDRVPRVARRTLLWVTIGGLASGLLCYVFRAPLLSV